MNIRTIGAIVGILVVTVGAYFFGYKNAQTEGELAIETMRKENAEAVIRAQDLVRAEYEEKMQNLATDLERVRNLDAQRLRQLEKFRNADRDLAACRSDRERLAKLAVEAESLLGEADSYLRACTK